MKESMKGGISQFLRLSKANYLSMALDRQLAPLRLVSGPP